MIKYRIKPSSKTKQYYNVFVFDTKCQMHKYLRDNEESLNCEALFSSFARYRISKTGEEKLLNNIGALYFYKRYFGSGVAAHELLHCALCWYKDQGNQFSELKFGKIHASKKQELLCDILQKLTRDFWHGWYKFESSVD